MLEKDNEPLGIQIRCLQSGGVFVSAVTVNSLAEQVGIIVGDQLLEVCGINMRSATKVTASTVLSQCGKSVTILVQNNRDKYEELDKYEESSSSSSLPGSQSRGATPTPRSSPPLSRNTSPPVLPANATLRQLASHGSPPPPSATNIVPSAAMYSESGQPAKNEANSFPPSPHSTIQRNIKRQGLSKFPSDKEQSDVDEAILDYSVQLDHHSKPSLSRQDTLKYKQEEASDIRSATLPSRQNSSAARGSGSNRNKPGWSSKRSNASAGDEQTRTVFLAVNKGSMGVRLVGGNASGVFIHVVLSDSPASEAALKPGDRILEYNGHDLRYATAEQASYELAKPADTVAMLVQYDTKAYNSALEQPGDGFYIRALFDNQGNESTQQLSFRKDDILYVDNTLYNSIPGVWRAWKVDENGQKKSWGTIPSKDKVEEALTQKGGSGSGVDLSTMPFAGGTVLSSIGVDNSKRGNTSARRSFFRRKKHSRSSSRDSKELASFSDASLNSYGEGGASAPVDDGSYPLAYLRVEPLDYLVKRPLILLGPLWEFVADRLCHDFPSDFKRCIPEVNKKALLEQLETAQAGGLVVEYRRRVGGAFDVTTLQQIQDISGHAVLDLSITAVERLHKYNIYPIILVMKFRSMKQVKEMCDAIEKNLPCKISPKEAKERFEMCSKLENEYKGLISAVVPAVVNLAYMCAQVKAFVDSEQKKLLWVPTL